MSKKLTTEEKIIKLDEKKEFLVKQQEEEKEKKENEKEKKEDSIFNGKKEKDFLLTDPSNICAMGRVQNFEDDDKPLHMILDFVRDNSDLEVYFDIKNGEVFRVFKDKKKWGNYSKEYYNRALEVAKAWKSDSMEFYCTNKKNEPILMCCDDLGFVLAPRVESGDEDDE
jgi:hypothetical protein